MQYDSSPERSSFFPTSDFAECRLHLGKTKKVLVFLSVCTTFAGSMKEKYNYKVAGHVFAVCNDTEDNIAQWLDHYKPFLIDTNDDETPVFTLNVKDRVEEEGFVQEIHQDDDGSEISAGHLSNGSPCFRFLLRHEQVATMITDCEYHNAELSMTSCQQFGLDNALMVMYALATATLQTALFHSSVIGYKGHGYMFLGKSGTGKSTHSSLWLRYIEGTELMNDDNPVVRITNGEARVYVSPWSGKTPCYRNIDNPLGAIVLLSQAPWNRIERLIKLQAYAAIVPSISGKRWDQRIAEGLHETENWLAGHTAVYHLECLPNEAAAQLCRETVATHP